MASFIALVHHYTDLFDSQFPSRDTGESMAQAYVLYTVEFEEGGELQEMPVAYSGFFSYGQRAEDVRPRATVGIFPVFYEKDIINVRA